MPWTAQRRTHPSGGAGSGTRDSGPGPILDAAPQHGRAWAEQLAGNLQLDLRLTNLLPVRYHHTKSLVAFSTCGYRVR